MKSLTVCCLTFTIIMTTPFVTSYAAPPTGKDEQCGTFDDVTMNRCDPPLINLAEGRDFRASESCSDGQRYKEITYVQDPVTSEFATELRRCKGKDAHPVSHLTDPSGPNVTYWQSNSMSSLDEREVTLTLSFRKSYEISYVFLKFWSIRPRAMAIYKSMNHGKSWTAFQYFAIDCEHYFDQKASEVRKSPQEVLCTQKYSEPLPFRYGEVVFNPVPNGSPDDLDNKFYLQEWVTATDIKLKFISLNNPLLRREPLRPVNGEISAQDPPTTPLNPDPSPFFYAVSDIHIGARCKCNGHGSSCVKRNGAIRCECRHNTFGVNCEKCRNNFNDRPWLRATKDNPNQCVR